MSSWASVQTFSCLCSLFGVVILNLDRSGLRKCSILQPPRFQGFVNMLLLFDFFICVCICQPTVTATDLCIHACYSWMWLPGDSSGGNCSPIQKPVPHLLLICLQQFRSNVLPPTWRSCWAPDQKRSDCRCRSRRKSGVHTEDSSLQTARLSNAVLSLCCHPQPLCLLYFGKVKNIFLEWNLDFMQIDDLCFFSLIISNKCKKKKMEVVLSYFDFIVVTVASWDINQHISIQDSPEIINLWM